MKQFSPAHTSRKSAHSANSMRRLLVRAGLVGLLACAAMAWLSDREARMERFQSNIPAGGDPRAIAVNPVTNKIYVANFGSANVTVINGADNTTATVLAGNTPAAIAVDQVTNKR